VRRRAVAGLGSCVIVLACLDAFAIDPRLACEPGRLTTPDSVPVCLHFQKTITQEDRDGSIALLKSAERVRDSLRADSSAQSLTNALYMTRALGGIGTFYAGGLFSDSARFHRMMDQVAVTLEFVRGTLPTVGPRSSPTSTPFLSWHLYANIGIYFQPVETSQLIAGILPRTNVPIDSLLGVSQQLWRYGLWRTHETVQYPVWEYEFPWTSGGIGVQAPWISGMAQASSMMLFAQCYLRTGDYVWRDRAMTTFRSLMVPWDQGGVLLPDTSQGYWFEEFHPVVQVWNGAAEALLQVGYLSSVTHDPEVQRVYERGLHAMKYYTPFYDTGSWTLYSRTQGLNTRWYHNFHVQLADALFVQSGDSFFKTVADRWRSYVPPPGVP